MILVNERRGRFVDTSWEDPTGLGMTLGIVLRSNSQHVVQIVSTYLPHHTGGNSLWNQAAAWLSSQPGLKRLHRPLLAISRILAQATHLIWKTRRGLPIIFEIRAGLAGPYSSYKRSYHHLSAGAESPRLCFDSGVPSALSETSSSGSESDAPETPPLARRPPGAAITIVQQLPRPSGQTHPPLSSPREGIG